MIASLLQRADKGLRIFYGWWVLIAATTVISAQGLIFYGFGVLFPSILEEFGWSRALTSSIFSIQIATNSIFIVLMGYLTDKYSTRALIGIGALFFGAGLIFSSLTRQIWHLYLFFGVIVGAGTSTMYVPPITVVTRWFEKRRGLALGIAVTGIGIGGFVGSPLLNWLIQSYGWRTALFILGTATGIVVFTAAMVLIGYPEAKGLQPYGAKAPKEAHDLQCSLAFENPMDSPSEFIRQDWTVWQTLKTRAFLILFLMFFFAEVSLVGVMAHLFTYATENGLSKLVVSWAYGTIGVTSLIGKVGAGALSDRIGRKIAFFLSFALKGTGFIFLIPAPNIFYLFIFAGTLGLSYGGWTPLFPAILSDFFGLTSMGKIFSVLTLNFLLGGTCGPILAGWLFDKMDSYFIAFVIFSGVCYVAAMISLLLKAPSQAPTHASRS